MLEAVSSNEIYDFLLLKTTKFGFIFTNMCWIIENNCKIWYDSEIFPQIIDQVGNNLDTAIYKQINMIKESIDETLKRQKETLEQAIEDIRKQKLEEDEKKKNFGIDIKNDLERIEEIRNELQ